MDIKITPLQQGKAHDLKALLESIGAHGAKSHAKIARLLYSHFESSNSASEKKVLAVEIFCKLMQSIEDYGALCLMWNVSRQAEPIYPLEKYLKARTDKIVRFFKRCEPGLPYDEIRAIWGLSSAAELIAAQLLKPDEQTAYESFVAQFLAEIDSNLRQIGRLFLETSDEKGYGDVVNMFFNAKHGVKVFFSTESSNHLELSDGFVTIVIGPGKINDPNNPSIKTESLILGKFGLREAVISRMVQNAEAIGEKTSLLARMRRKSLDNDHFIAEDYRKCQKLTKLGRDGRLEAK